MAGPVLIAGGGIAGLACALALARRGHAVQVLERRQEFSELGAGIQLAPNALHALERLGVLPAVLASAIRVSALTLMDARNGEQLARLPLDDDFEERFGQSYVVVHRCDLYGVLLDACRAHALVQLRPGCGVTGYEHDKQHIWALLVTGERVPGAALIGADGLHSAVRSQLLGDGAPELIGHTTFRAVVPMSQVPPPLRRNEVILWAGPQIHVVHYPIAGGESLNLVATRDNGATQPLAGVPLTVADVQAHFPDLADVPRALIDLAPEWRSWTPSDRAPSGRWCDGVVVLVGDAAHPMVQYAAQGACMALEDAVALGELAGQDWPEAFADFADRRLNRTADVQRTARHLGKELYHPAGAAAVQRNTLLADLSAHQMRERVAWIYDRRAGEA